MQGVLSHRWHSSQWDLAITQDWGQFNLISPIHLQQVSLSMNLTSTFPLVAWSLLVSPLANLHPRDPDILP